MSALVAAVKAELDKRGRRFEDHVIADVLFAAGVTSAASRGVPVRLRIRNLRVTGTKRYTDGPEVSGASVAMEMAPIDLNWSPRDGVNGVGSEVNLRGKSSVLHFVRWAMTGRSHLQADVLSWVESVVAEFELDGVPLHVEIKMIDGVPTGSVQQEISEGRATLGSFKSDAEFASLMSSVMLDRLRLGAFPVFAKGTEVEHSWPSYVSALSVYADQLDPIIGNESTLKTRSLQMFVGTSWARVDAEVATALNAREFQHKETTQRRNASADANVGAIEEAKQRLADAKARLAQHSSGTPDLNEVLAQASTAAERAQEAHDIARRLMTARDVAYQVEAQLRAEEFRKQAAAEEAVARRLFNGMTPTVCPRCSTKVTAERYKAEVTEHECSLCTADFGHQMRPDTTAPASVGSGMHPEDTSVSHTSLAVADVHDEPEPGTDPLQALSAAAADARAVVARFEHAFDEAEVARSSAEAAAEVGQSNLGGARLRLSAELEIARAEGALESMQRTVTIAEASPWMDDNELLILQTAHKLTKEWVKDEQDPVLAEVSKEITALARQFGATNIRSVHLKGNGNMDVDKGGVPTTYSGVTNGEKLRIKLAAAIALIRIGHRDGVGRHPGLLFIDSPAAEEIPEGDLKTMLLAMTAVAKETTMQIVVATTHSAMLKEMLPPENTLVATGRDFVW